MTPQTFPGANAHYQAPGDMDESQVFTIPAYHAQVVGGNCDGALVVVTCWKPSPEDLAELNRGKPLFLSFLGGLPPHYPTMHLVEAQSPGIVLINSRCIQCGERNRHPAHGWNVNEGRLVDCVSCQRAYEVIRRT